VYYGPALSGKTTSLKSLFNHFGKLEDVISIENSVERTLFFDYGTIIFQNEHWNLKIHIYSTTGQDFYIVTRPTTLKAIDGVLFIADSNEAAYERNLISWNELQSYFKDVLRDLPIVLCFNKQDIPNKFESMRFIEKINYNEYKNIAVEYTIALNGEGILTSFENMLKLIFQDITRSEMVASGSTYSLN
jgi:GTPase SAR1 family protein